MNEIGRLLPHNIVLFGSPHGALRDVDPSSEYMYILWGTVLLRICICERRDVWLKLNSIYGDEPQLIEEENASFLGAYPDPSSDRIR